MRPRPLALLSALLVVATVQTGLVGAATRGVSLMTAQAATRPLQFVYEAGGPGTGGPGQLSGGAAGVTVDSDGNPWVSDSNANRIVKYDYNGNFIAALTGPAGGGGTFNDPLGIAADTAGFVYVADSGNNRVVKIDTGGDFVRTFGTTGPIGERLICPCYDAVDAKGTLYVTEAGGLAEYAPNGSFIKKIVKVDTPRYVAVDSSTGDIYLTDGAGGNIVHLNAAGVQQGALKAATGSANGLAFDSAFKVLYFSDFGKSIVREFSPSLASIQTLGQSGLMFGQMNDPDGLALDCRGTLYVVDSGTVPLGSKLMKFVDPASPPPPCAPPPLPGALDTQVNDVEITQGTQPLRAYTATDRPGGRTRAYGVGTNEVPLRITTENLVRKPTTVVRVYANLRSGPPAGVGGIPATLSVDKSSVCGPGVKQPTIQPDAGPAVLKVGGTTVDTPQRTDPAGAYTFTLPDDWTGCIKLNLTARVNPAGINCNQACQDRSTFHLTGIRFNSTPVGVIHPIALIVDGQYPALNGHSLQADPTRAFAPALAVTPFELQVWGWATQIDITDIADTTSWKVEKCFLGISLGILCSDKVYTPADGQDFRDAIEGALMDRIDDYVNDNYPYKIATHNGWVKNTHLYYGLLSNQGVSGVLAGSTRGELFDEPSLFTPPTDWVPRLYAVLTRPLTSMAHELNHALGRQHASDCNGGGSNGQTAEGWPPDEQGYLDGIGLDPRPGSGGFRGPYRLIAPGLPAAPAQVYDFMSYCASDSDSWISPKGWDEVITYNNSGATAAAPRRRLSTRSAASRQEVLSMTALQFGDGTLAMTNVSPQFGYESNGDPSSPYVLEDRDAAGKILASVSLDAKPLHVHGDPGLLLIAGSIRRVPGTAQLVLRRGTETATRRQRSAHPPTVKLLAPLSGTLRTRRLAVRWRASDADNDRLTAQVDYSPDGGRNWNPVWVGSSRGHATVPVTLLKASRNARLRVRVDDGFDAAAATSGHIVVRGAPPAVVIESPVVGERLLSGAPLHLSGVANGDEGSPLGDGALRWFDGRRLLGRGGSLSVIGLAPGHHTIRLEAREGSRLGSASVRILIRGVKPAFLALGVPAHVARGARSVRLRVATTVAATLSVSRQRFGVGPNAKAITVRIKVGTSTLMLVVRAAGLTTRQTISLPRG